MASLLQYRQYVAKELGLFVSSVVSAGSGTGQLLDTAWPITSSLPQDDLYRDCFLLRPGAAAADRVRVVQTYTPGGGSLVPDTVWTAAPAQGEAYELHGVVEPFTALRDVINEALKRCFVIVEIALPTIAQQQRHQLTASWAEDQSWVRQVGWLGPAEDRNQIDPYRRVVRGRTAENGGGFWLEHPGFAWTGNEILYVQTVKRAYDQCSGFVWTYFDATTMLGSGTVTSATANFAQTDIGAAIAGYGIPAGAIIIAVRSATSCTMSAAATATQSGLTITLTRLQSGLLGDTDTAPVDLELVGAAALVEAWRRYGQVLETGARGRLLSNQKEAAARFAMLASQYFTLPPMTFRTLVYGGPRQRSGFPLGGY